MATDIAAIVTVLDAFFQRFSLSLKAAELEMDNKLKEDFSQYYAPSNSNQDESVKVLQSATATTCNITSSPFRTSPLPVNNRRQTWNDAYSLDQRQSPVKALLDKLTEQVSESAAATKKINLLHTAKVGPMLSARGPRISDPDETGKLGSALSARGPRRVGLAFPISEGGNIPTMGQAAHRYPPTVPQQPAPSITTASANVAELAPGRKSGDRQLGHNRELSLSALMSPMAAMVLTCPALESPWGADSCSLLTPTQTTSAPDHEVRLSCQNPVHNGGHIEKDNGGKSKKDNLPDKILCSSPPECPASDKAMDLAVIAEAGDEVSEPANGQDPMKEQSLHLLVRGNEGQHPSEGPDESLVPSGSLVDDAHSNQSPQVPRAHSPSKEQSSAQYTDEMASKYEQSTVISSKNNFGQQASRDSVSIANQYPKKTTGRARRMSMPYSSTAAGSYNRTMQPLYNWHDGSYSLNEVAAYDSHTYGMPAMHQQYEQHYPPLGSSQPRQSSVQQSRGNFLCQQPTAVTYTHNTAMSMKLHGNTVSHDLKARRSSGWSSGGGANALRTPMDGQLSAAAPCFFPASGLGSFHTQWAPIQEGHSEAPCHNDTATTSVPRVSASSGRNDLEVMRSAVSVPKLNLRDLRRGLDHNGNFDLPQRDVACRQDQNP